LTVAIGGVAGFGSSEAKATVTLEKSRFGPGEKIRVAIYMDNSACKKAVKSFKIKLARKITVGINGSPTPFEKEEYLNEIKYEGCGEKTKQNRTFDFELATDDKGVASIDNLHPDMRHMVKMLTDSAKNTQFQIEYRLDVFIKHQSKTEFGMGNKLEFPIQIHSYVYKVPFMSTKETTWLMA